MAFRFAPAPALALLLAAHLAAVSGHGAITSLLSRNSVDGLLPQFADGKWPSGTVGCNCRPNGCDAGVRSAGGGQPCLWFSQGCTIGCPTCDGKTQHTNASLCGSPKQPTVNDPRFRTVNRGAKAGSVDDVYRFNPWRAPGSAPVVDACGMAGGALHPGGGAALFAETPFAKQGDLGTKVLLPAPSGAVWDAGSAVEVAWGIRFNHGGGYQYRLCPANETLTEACFQRTPLPFAQATQYLEWVNGTREEIPAVLVSEGTLPAGSAWAMNPIPRIDFDSTSSGQPAGFNGCTRPAIGEACLQFAPPCKNDHGWGPPHDVDVEGPCSGDATGLQIVDRVRIPAHLPTGHYVLGWRWDCEETAQVWSNCADVYIVAANSTK